MPGPFAASQSLPHPPRLAAESMEAEAFGRAGMGKRKSGDVGS
jgi:hypothetical protein